MAGRAYRAPPPALPLQKQPDLQWRDLVERAVGRIADTLAAAAAGSVTLVRVKEKYASLRVYWRGTRLTKATEREIADAIALAEARSACTCETCGQAGVLHQVGGLLMTACVEHAKGKVVPVAPGWENLHVVSRTNSAYLSCKASRFL